MITLSAFLTSTGGIVVVNILTSFLKRYVEPRYGVRGIHAVVLGLSLVASTVMQYMILDGVLPDFTTVLGIQHYLALAGTVFTAAIAMYEVLLKRIGLN